MSMPLGRKFAIGSEEARRQRAELRTSYGNKLSNMNLGRLRNRSHPATATTTRAKPGTAMAAGASCTTPAMSALRRIASSFAHVSDVVCGSCAALPHEDTEEDVIEERTEVLLRSEPFKSPSLPTKTASSCALHSCSSNSITASACASASTYAEAHRDLRSHYPCVDSKQSRASERWGQIACTVSALFRVRRITHANPLSELRRLREQRDLLEAFTRPFLYEDNAHSK